MLRQIAYFLCIIDETPQLNLPDLAFMIILAKVIFASQVDWAAMVTLAIAVLNAMHNRQTVATQDITTMTSNLQNLKTTVDTLKARL